jgi:hypothetical protein
VDPYDARAWALVDSGVDICIVCCDLFEIELDIHELNPGYSALKYIISIDMLMIPSSFVGVDGLTVEFQAKIVNRQSLPNAGVGVSIIIRQRVPLSNNFLIFQLPSTRLNSQYLRQSGKWHWRSSLWDSRLSRVLPKKTFRHCLAKVGWMMKIIWCRC